MGCRKYLVYQWIPLTSTDGDAGLYRRALAGPTHDDAPPRAVYGAADDGRSGDCGDGALRISPGIPLVEEVSSVDPPYHALSRKVTSWSCGPEPSVTADVYEGSISVLPGTAGRITADILAVSLTKRSQAAADRALGSIDVATRPMSNGVEIIARGDASVPGRRYITNDVHVQLFVPAGIRLDLRVGRGQIAVGSGSTSGGNPLHQPVDASAIRAYVGSKQSVHVGDGKVGIYLLKPSTSSGGARGK
jgi:hypothetical protein